jgi:DNA polymerase elongation subunit (family B)
MSELIDALELAKSVGKRLKKQDVRVLVIDIENSPNIADVWSLWNNNVGLAQLRQSGQVISFAAKWLGEPTVLFHSDFHDGHEAMIEAAYKLVNEADIIIGYNSQGFDMKHLHREFLTAGFPPPLPYKNIDLLHAVKKAFKFPSNKLDYVVQALKLGAKTAHTGHVLWVQCMANEPRAWALMKRYNMQDVRVTEKLYYRILPWIEKHPHIGMYMATEHDRCPFCGSADLELQSGTAKANVTTYDLYRCGECQGVSRSTTRGREQDKLFTRKVRSSQ